LCVFRATILGKPENNLKINPGLIDDHEWVMSVANAVCAGIPLLDDLISRFF
jgi:hypothetical protein